MKTTLKLAAVTALLTSLAACSGLSRQQTHAAIGAGAGGALGYVLTGGPVGTIAGAARARAEAEAVPNIETDGRK